VINRFIFRRDGTIRMARLVALLGVTIGLAIFGTAAIWLAPTFLDGDLSRGLWVMFAVVGLKLPIVVVLWSFIRRNAEWPGQPVRWSPPEVGAILANLSLQAERVSAYPNALARLEFLSREAWNVADQLGGADKVDALTVALRIDEQLLRERERHEAR
jgi:hypothetical protein